MWKMPDQRRPPSHADGNRSVDYTTLATLRDILKRVIRVESKIHALAKGLKVDISQQLVEELQEELPQ